MKLKSVNKENKELAKGIDKETFKSMVELVSTNKDLKVMIYGYLNETSEEKDEHFAYTVGSFEERVKYLASMSDAIAEGLRSLDCVDKIREMQTLWEGGFTYKTEFYYSPLTLVLVMLDEYRTLPYSVEEWYAQNKEAFLKALDALIIRKKFEPLAESEKVDYRKDLKKFMEHNLPTNCSLTLASFLKREGALGVYDDENAVKAYKKFSDYIAKRFENKILGHNPNLKRFTYKSMVKDYFGLDLVEGENAPKLAKQLKKADISYTDEEIRHFGEVQRWWEDWYGTSFRSTIDDRAIRSKDLWIDMKDFNIPYLVNNWAFNSSCNHSNSSSGADTHLILKYLGFEYLKGYSTYWKNGSYALCPSLRTYFLQYEGNLGHAGSYADFEGTRAKACYEFTTVLLCIVFGKKVGDFSKVEGMDIDCDHIYSENLGYHFSFWANQANNEYSKFGTDSEIFSEIDRYCIKDYIDNEVPIRYLLDNIDENTRYRILNSKPFFGELKLTNSKDKEEYKLLTNLLKELEN